MAQLLLSNYLSYALKKVLQRLKEYETSALTNPLDPEETEMTLLETMKAAAESMGAKAEICKSASGDLWLRVAMMRPGSLSRETVAVCAFPWDGMDYRVSVNAGEDGLTDEALASALFTQAHVALSLVTRLRETEARWRAEQAEQAEQEAA